MAKKRKVSNRVKKGSYAKEENKGNPDLKPSAHYTKVLQGQEELEAQVKKAEEVLRWLKDRNVRYWAICRIMYVSGARISEVLELECSAVDAYGLFYIQGKKGARQLVVNDSELSKFMKRFHRCQGLVFFGITRFQVYKALKEYGLEFKAKGSKKVSVTHFFRHLFTKRMRVLEVSKESIKETLRHRSSKSQEHYGKD